jgi:predicted nucleotidyltransferase
MSRGIAWAFGSRVQGTARPYSDLDLVVIAGTPLPLTALAALADDFSRSDLPWKVDVWGWATTGEAGLSSPATKVVLQGSREGRMGAAGG